MSIPSMRSICSDTVRCLVLFAALTVASAPSCGTDGAFPHKMPDRKPDISLSTAMERMFDPIPKDGGLADAGSWERRTTQYDWGRTWKLEDDTPAATGMTGE